MVKDQGSRIKGSGIRDQGSGIRDQGSRIRAPVGANKRAHIYVSDKNKDGEVSAYELRRRAGKEVVH